MTLEHDMLAWLFQAFGLKFVEMGKVLFAMSIIEGSEGQQVSQHVSFLHEELLKLPSFPRKALEAEFGLHQGEHGKVLYGLDMMHKYVWTKVFATRSVVITTEAYNRLM